MSTNLLAIVPCVYARTTRGEMNINARIRCVSSSYSTTSSCSSSGCQLSWVELTHGVLTFSPRVLTRPGIPPRFRHIVAGSYHRAADMKGGKKTYTNTEKENVSFLCLFVDSYINGNVDKRTYEPEPTFIIIYHQVLFELFEKGGLKLTHSIKVGGAIEWEELE